MKRTITLVAMLAMMIGLVALPAAAYDTPEYAALEEALAEAQDDVDRLKSEIEELESQITEAQSAVDVQQDVVDNLANELEAAEEDLKVAEDRLAELTAIRAACAQLPTPPERNECRNATNPEFNALTASVPQLQGEVDRIEGLLADEQEELERLEAIVKGLVENKEATEDELAKAIIIRDAAQEALDAYVPPSADVHPGCKGISNAQVQLGKNGAKGKAPAVLEAVAGKFGC
jgi:predicted  nucleic acid-binding Zn-ribbon protein